MAVVRARSAPPYGAFAGFLLFGVAAVAAVAFYIMWAQDANDSSAAKSSLTRIGSIAEQTDFQNAVGYDPNRKDSVLKQALASYQAMRKQLGDATLERDSLRDQVAGLKKSVADFQQVSADAEASRKEASTELQTARDGFAKQVATLNDQVATLNNQIASANRDRDAAVASGEDKLNRAQQDWDDKNRANVIQLEQDKSEIAKRDAQLLELRERIINTGAHGVNSNVGDPDSTVVRVNQATGECYILLGKKDRVVPGLTFTAYDPRLGVRYGTDEQAAGNGSMEVIEVGDTTSLCRITHTTPGKGIQAGDLIANPVYHNDRTRQFRFVVRGDFDLDGDGIATAAERDRIVRLIVSWGGRVDDKVTPQTDFIVMGERPSNIASVETIGDAATTTPATAPEAGSVADERKTEQSDYDNTVIEGKRLAIPVLNDHRFLSMIGYYNTTIVRYDQSSAR